MKLTYYTKKGLILLFLINFSFHTKAQKIISDNNNGTYTNPIIYADFPDPDVIMVDSVYYMVTTTMFVFPGVTILKSYDLVNWEYCSNAVKRMDFSPCYNLENCNRYGHGQWATSIKHNNDKFYLLFITLDEGGFICSSDKPEGPWEITQLPKGFYDPGLFFDDNGKIYVVHGYGNIYITELNEDFSPKSNDSLVFVGNIRGGLEGSHAYKINDYYYLYSTYGGPDGFQVALRSKNIYGPYEQKIAIRDTIGESFGIHQGALVQTVTEDWWTILFIDNGPFGRMPSLQPVKWENNWPIVGINGTEGVTTYPKPNVGKVYPTAQLPTSDDFKGTELGMQWGWNHNPDSTKWSLSENKGHLRLSTVSVTTSLKEARNTLTQRIFGYYSNDYLSTASTKLNIENMKNGDVAGLCVFQDPYAYIGVKKENDSFFIIMVNNGKEIAKKPTTKKIVYLKAYTDNNTRIASFAYCFNNKTFIPIGNQLLMKFNLTVFTGNKFGIFNYATQRIGGYVDFDWFKTQPESKIPE